MSTTEQPQWFAMRATYNRVSAAQKLLQENNIHTFVPMKWDGKSNRRLVPAIGNLIFVRGMKSEIQKLKQRVPYLQYLVNTRTREKIIVPDSQMEHFIAVCGTLDDHLIWLKPEDIDLRKGQRVRITGGEFEGFEGIFIKVRGARDRRVVIEIKGVMAVAMATIHPSLIEKIA